jgi:2-oxoglutarate/2-oxoacid ferredoxin oxidoreductase subunit alpha
LPIVKLIDHKYTYSKQDFCKMTKEKAVSELDHAVVKFAGDSGDGMQLAGTLFTNDAVLHGNDVATFPDYPAEIRAPQNTVAGVSGFQINIGKEKIYTPGDECDVLVVMNPASLKANLKWCKKNTIILADADSFTTETLSKAGYSSNPLTDGSLKNYIVVKTPVSSGARKAAEAVNSDMRTADKCRNMFALGMVQKIFGRKLDYCMSYFENKFSAKTHLVNANKAVLEAGFQYIATLGFVPHLNVQQSSLEKGKYRNTTGNMATAWGLLAASERSGRPLFLGSYPITPATEILIELAKCKSLGAKVFQAEDEIAGICSAIGASFAGCFAITTTSGPGLSLKSEAIGLAVMIELPLVIVDVQRGGPSTGLPTKSEQGDLMQTLFGRNGEAPIIVIAASSPSDCFYFAYLAGKYSMEHMTPVMLLTDGYLGNGSELFKIPKISGLPSIKPPIVKANNKEYKPYKRNPETLVRGWALPGTEGLRHRIGGLEKENISGSVSTDPQNHELMVKLRQQKVDKVADFFPLQEIEGVKNADLLVVGWGSSYGAIKTAVEGLMKKGKKIAFTNFNYICPLPKNTKKIFFKYKKILVCELNMGQFADYLRMKHPEFIYHQFNKIQGQPFTVMELQEEILKTLRKK